jgi:amino acid transporter
MTLGWPLVTAATMLVALSLAELASAYPTAGALYHWSSILGGPGAGWLAAWLNLVGQVGVVAGVDYAFAEFLRPALGLPDTRGNLLVLYAAVLFSHGMLNHVGIRVVTVLNEVSAWYHLACVALLVGALVRWAPLQPAAFLVERFVGANDDGTRFPFVYACLVGLLQAQWTFTGYDASAHAAEETLHAQEAAPRGIVNSVIVSGVAGFVMLAVITLAIADLPAAAASPNAFTYILTTALGARLGGWLVWMVIGAMWFCGLSSVTSNSRMLFAFARDGGLPGAATLAQVSPRFRTPAWAIWACVITAFLLAVWSQAYSVIVSISTIGLYGSYGLAIWGALRARREGWRASGPWTLGRWSNIVNVAALGWIGVITVLFVLPPNERTGYTVAGLLAALAVYYVVWVRLRFRGPVGLPTR